MLAALSMDLVVGLIATQEAGAASEMPCAAPPIRLYPAGTATAELDADGLAVGLLDTVAEADGVAGAAGFTVARALPHDVTAMLMPIITGTAAYATLMRTITAFLVYLGKRTGDGTFKATRIFANGLPSAGSVRGRVAQGPGPAQGRPVRIANDSGEMISAGPDGQRRRRAGRASGGPWLVSLAEGF